MKRLYPVLLVASTLLLALWVAGCGGKSRAGDIADSLEDRLTDALNFEDGQREDGAPGEGSDSAEAPQVLNAQLPEALRLGEPFVVAIETAFDAGERPLKAVVYVKGASRHIHVEARMLPSALGKQMMLFGVLSVDLDLRDKRFELEVALKTQDGIMGMPYGWPLTIRDEAPQELPGEPIDLVNLTGEEWFDSGRPEGEAGENAPQIRRIEGPASFPVGLSRQVGPVSRNVAKPDDVVAVLLSVPGNPGYKRSRSISPRDIADGIFFGVDVTLNAQVPVGSRMVLLFALENEEGRVGLFRPYVFTAVEEGWSDGDEPDGDRPDGDTDGDSDGDRPDGDTDGDSDGDEPDGDDPDGDSDGDEPDGDDPECVCELVNDCCDGCLAINENGICEATLDDAWTGYCHEGACVSLTRSDKSLFEDAPYIESCVLSPDGNSLATATGGRIHFWDMNSSFAPIYDLDGGVSEVGFVTDMAYSPDGSRLLVSFSMTHLLSFDMTLPNPEVSAAWFSLGTAFGPSGRLVFSADGAVLWVVANSMTAYRVALPGMTFFSSPFASPPWRAATGDKVAWMERMGTGQLLASANADNFQFFDLLDPGLVRVGPGFAQGLEGLAVSPLGNEIAVLACLERNMETQLCTNFAVSRWRPDQATPLAERTLNLPAPLALAWSPEGNTLAVAYCVSPESATFCQGSAVLLLDRTTLETRHVMANVSDRIIQIFHDRRGETLFALSEFAKVTSWQLGPFSPPFTWECDVNLRCGAGYFCDLYTHRCRRDACRDNVDNDSDGMTDQDDPDCDNGRMEVVNDAP